MRLGRRGSGSGSGERGGRALDAAEKAASDYVLVNVFKQHGPGPHKITVDGQEKIVTFQQVNKAIRARFLNLGDVT